MARYPGADWRPMPENNTEPAIVPTQVILHSAVSGRDNLDEYFRRTGVDVESHFYVRWDGSVQQYVDTSKQADANYQANARAISIETEDDGDPDRKPWSPQQMASLTALVTWLCDTHDIPKRPCRGPLDPGIGYHSQFRDWSPVAKTCPGLARRPQVPQIIAAVAGVAGSRIPNLIASEEDDMFEPGHAAQLSDAQQKANAAWVTANAVLAELRELAAAQKAPTLAVDDSLVQRLAAEIIKQLAAK